MPERDVRIRIFIDDKNIKALEQLNAGLQKAAVSEKALHKSMTGKNTAGRKQKKVLADDKKALKSLGDFLVSTDKKTKTWTQTIIKNIGKVAEWAIATGIIYGSIRTLRTAIDDIMEVEFAMAGLTKVMRDGENRSRTLKSELLELGHQYGELGTSVIDASTEWARLQLSTFEIAQNAETALLAQAVAEMEVVDATRYLIASMQQFEQTSLANIRTLDQWNELSNRMAVRAIDLAQATGRAGSVIHNTADSMQFLNGMTAALVQATGRSGQAIGTAIRTFGTYAYRMRSITVLEQSGIKVRNKATGALRSFADVLTQIAIQWDGYTDSQKRAIAQSIAGTRRQNEFITLMREFPEVLKATVIAAESFGSAQKESVILLDTAQKKAQQLRSGLQRLMATFLEVGPMKTFLDLLNGLINALIEAREVVIILGIGLTVFATKVAVVAIAGTKLGAAIKGLIAGFWILNPWLIAAVGGAVALGTAWRMFRKEIETTTDVLVVSTQKDAQQVIALQARVSQLDTLIKMYENLRQAQKESMGDEFEGRLKSIGQDIQSVARNIDSGFIFNTEKWGDSLTRAKEILGGIETDTERQRERTRQSLLGRVELLQRIIKLWETYESIIKKLPAAKAEFPGLDEKKFRQRALVESFEQTFGDIRKIIAKDLGDATDQIESLLLGTGLIATSVFKGNFVVNSQEAREAMQNLRATLATVEKALQSIAVSTGFRANIAAGVLSIEEIRASIERLNETNRHRAAMAVMAGASELNSLMLTRDAIDKSIKLVEDQIIVYQANGEAVDKLTSLLGKLETQQRNVNNRMIEAAKSQIGDAISEAVVLQRKALQDLSVADIQVAKGKRDNITATNLSIDVMEREGDALRAGIALRRLLGHATDDLERELKDLNAQIALEAELLDRLIAPQQRAREQRDALKKSDSEYQTILKGVTTELDRQTRAMAVDVSAVKIAQYRVDVLSRLLKLSKQYNITKDSEREIINSLAEAYSELNMARGESLEERLLEGLTRNRNEMERQMALSKAWGASDIALAQERIAMLERQRQQVKNSGLEEIEKKKQVKELTNELRDATNDLAVAEVTAARDSAEAWIESYEKRYDAWAKLLGRKLSRKGVMETLERIQQEMVDRWIRQAFAPIIEKLTKWEFQMLGISPEQMRRQEENKNKMIMALVTGGKAVQKSIVSGANYHAAAITSAMSGQAMPTLPGGIGVPGGGKVFGPPSPTPTPGAGATAAMYGIGLGPQILSNVKDWGTGRGGGVRAAGFGIGAGVGAMFGGPQGAALGGQLGQSLVSTLQDLKHAIWDDEERRRPQSETLRQQVGSAINRGTFGQASQITYYQEFNFNMGFMIPEREGIRKAAAILKSELLNINANVTVGA